MIFKDCVKNQLVLAKSVGSPFGLTNRNTVLIKNPSLVIVEALQINVKKIFHINLSRLTNISQLPNLI
jgi:hypothetical protein